MSIASKMQFQRSKRFGKSKAGQAQVEFLFSVLFILLVVISVVEIIVLMYTYTVLADGAKEGVRYAIVHGCGLNYVDPVTMENRCSGTCTPACTDSTGTKVGDYVKNNYLVASLHDKSAMTVSVTYPDSSSLPTKRVRVTVSYPYQPFFGLGWPTVTVRAAAEGRIFY